MAAAYIFDCLKADETRKGLFGDNGKFIYDDFKNEVAKIYPDIASNLWEGYFDNITLKNGMIFFAGEGSNYRCSFGLAKFKIQQGSIKGISTPSSSKQGHGSEIYETSGTGNGKPLALDSKNPADLGSSNPSPARRDERLDDLRSKPSIVEVLEAIDAQDSAITTSLTNLSKSEFTKECRIEPVLSQWSRHLTSHEGVPAIHRALTLDNLISKHKGNEEILKKLNDLRILINARNTYIDEHKATIGTNTSRAHKPISQRTLDQAIAAKADLLPKNPQQIVMGIRDPKELAESEHEQNMALGRLLKGADRYI